MPAEKPQKVGERQCRYKLWEELEELQQRRHRRRSCLYSSWDDRHPRLMGESPALTGSAFPHKVSSSLIGVRGWRRPRRRGDIIIGPGHPTLRQLPINGADAPSVVRVIVVNTQDITRHRDMQFKAERRALHQMRDKRLSIFYRLYAGFCIITRAKGKVGAESDFRGFGVYPHNRRRNFYTPPPALARA